MFMALKNCHDIKQYFKRQLLKQRYCIDRSGQRTIELLGACFEADKPAIFGTPNKEYIKMEIAWYDAQVTNVFWMEPTPAIWKQTANDKGQINSNYGYLIYNDKFHNQYERCLEELQKQPTSRRACMIYNRPSIWKEYNEDGKNDFICTNAVSYVIRDGLIHATVQMRSNDAIFGYKNDRAWQLTILERLAADLKCKTGRIIWQVQNLHVYERHFKLVT